jgi:hypothetical protein
MQRTSMDEHFVLSEDDVIDMFLYPGWREELQAGEVERARREVSAHLDRFCAMGMRVRVDEGGRRFFDPIALNLICERGIAENDPFWHERAIAPRREIAATIARSDAPRRLTYELHREIAVPNRSPGSKVISSLALPVDESTQREITVTALPISDAKITIERGMLTARSIVDADRRVRFGVRISAIGYQQTIAIDPQRVVHTDTTPELAPYLARSEGIIRITPSVDRLARKLARGGPWETVNACWGYLFDEHRVGSLYHFELDPEDPLGSTGKWVDCYIGSALFVALVRASGIPARMVAGALFYPGADMGQHYWSEVYFAAYGWVPFDLHGWILAAGDRHDPRWGRFLVGHLPYQLVFERLPRLSLELGPRYPRRWYSTTKLDGVGQRYRVFDLDTQELAFTDYYIATIGAEV